MGPDVRRSVLAAGLAGAFALVALISNASLGDEAVTGVRDGPVISLGEPWNAYPDALVTGRLTLAGDCLLLGSYVVFWPHETSWEGDQHTVQFHGDFEGAAPIAVGDEFTGGGGFYSASDMKRIESLDSGSLVRCAREAGTDGAVFAYPQMGDR